jgi:hypothetical protein
VTVYFIPSGPTISPLWESYTAEMLVAGGAAGV